MSAIKGRFFILSLGILFLVGSTEIYSRCNCCIFPFFDLRKNVELTLVTKCVRCALMKPGAYHGGTFVSSVKYKSRIPIEVRFYDFHRTSSFGN